MMWQTRFHQNISKICGGRTRTQRGGGYVRFLFRKFSRHVSLSLSLLSQQQLQNTWHLTFNSYILIHLSNHPTTITGNRGAGVKARTAPDVWSLAHRDGGEDAVRTDVIRIPCRSFFDEDDESIGFSWVKRMTIARDLQNPPRWMRKAYESISRSLTLRVLTRNTIHRYESMLETISFVFGEAQNFVRSFDNGTNVSEAQTSFEMLFNTSKKDGVPKLVRDHLVSTLKKLVQKLKNDGETRSRIHQKQNDDIRVFVLLPMAYRELEASEHRDSILEPFCAALSSLNSKARFRLVNIWSRDVAKNHFEGVLAMLHNFVTLRLYTWEGGAASLFSRISRVLTFMQLLFKANELHEKREADRLWVRRSFTTSPWTERSISPGRTYCCSSNYITQTHITLEHDTNVADNEMCFCKFPFIMNAANKAWHWECQHKSNVKISTTIVHGTLHGRRLGFDTLHDSCVRRDQIVETPCNNFKECLEG